MVISVVYQKESQTRLWFNNKHLDLIVQVVMYCYNHANLQMFTRGFCPLVLIYIKISPEFSHNTIYCKWCKTYIVYSCLEKSSFWNTAHLCSLKHPTYQLTCGLFPFLQHQAVTLRIFAISMKCKNLFVLLSVIQNWFVNLWVFWCILEKVRSVSEMGFLYQVPICPFWLNRPLNFQTSHTIFFSPLCIPVTNRQHNEKKITSVNNLTKNIIIILLKYINNVTRQD